MQWIERSRISWRENSLITSHLPYIYDHNPKSTITLEPSRCWLLSGNVPTERDTEELWKLESLGWWWDCRWSLERNPWIPEEKADTSLKSIPSFPQPKIEEDADNGDKFKTPRIFQQIFVWLRGVINNEHCNAERWKETECVKTLLSHWIKKTVPTQLLNC